jgi:hypothetical protein
MLSGPSGAGKTKTGLIVATVLAADDDGRILVIDTEKESALTYADDFDFNPPPVAAAVRPPRPRCHAPCTEAGRTYSVVMVDSPPTSGAATGGTLDIAGGKFTGWKDARPAQEDLVDAILTLRRPRHRLLPVEGRTRPGGRERQARRARSSAWPSSRTTTSSTS